MSFNNKLSTVSFGKLMLNNLRANLTTVCMHLPNLDLFKSIPSSL